MKIGSIVNLNSGGPDMTVLLVHNDSVFVEWDRQEGAKEGCVLPIACVTAKCSPPVPNAS